MSSITIQDELTDDAPVGGAIGQVSARRTPTEIPTYRYISAEFAELEMRQMWPHVWQLACSVSHVRDPGDFFEYRLGNLSVLVVRDSTGRLRAYQNVCRHRGNILCSGAGQGLDVIRCQYHRWAWSLEGQLREVPSRKGFGALRNDDLPLFEVAVDTWGPLVFINLDLDCEPLADWLEVIPQLCEWAGFGDYACAYDLSVLLPCNWKTLIEAFSETYHVQGVHREMLPSCDDVNSQNRLYGRHGSLYQPYGICSPRLRDGATNQQIWESLAVTQGARYGADGQNPGPCPPLEDGQTMREMLAGLVRERAAREGWEIGGGAADRFTESQLLDLFQFNLFPNASVIVMCDTATVLRARPGGHPDEAWLDLLHLDRMSAVKPAPERPMVAVLDADNVDLNLVFNQDVENLKRAQLGLHQPGLSHIVLSREEMRIANLHHQLEEFLDISPSEISDGSWQEIQQLRQQGRAEMEPTGFNAPW